MPFPTRHSKNTKRRRSPKRPDMSGINNAAKAVDEAAQKFFRTLTKDHAHTGTFLLLIDKPLPGSGFWAYICYAIKCFFVTIGVALARVFLIILLYILLFAFLAFIFFGLGSK